MHEDFDEFAVAAWPRLRHAAWLLTGHDQDAEDLASAALAKTFAAWRRVRSEQPYAYARRCVLNAQIDRVRRRRNRVELVTDVVPDIAESGVGGGSAQSDRIADRDQLAALLGTLSVRERQIVVLRYYFDSSEAEVAEELGISVGTVKSTASRALARLRVENGSGLEVHS
ncbi:RNA polymerase sigma-70 factor (sigma-E family) [Marmoricola sp. OAE513]|uniref:SigE family RNA polymerase sigma factor n=1 Tax=Marmoricola sp. OAE513 TaxID=2817894 RepID=UPI001D3367AD